MLLEYQQAAELAYLKSLSSMPKQLSLKKYISKLIFILFRSWLLRKWSGQLAQSLGQPKNEVYAKLLKIENVYKSKDLKKYLDSINKAFPNFPGYPFILQGNFSTHIRYVCRYFKKMKNRVLPKIPFIAFQKSASSFVSVVLCQLLEIPPTILSLNHTVGIASWTNAFGKWGGVTHDHYYPYPENLKLLQEAGIKKCIIHRRNPLHALISLAFHALNNDPKIDNKLLTPEKQIVLVREYLNSEMENILNSYLCWHRNWRKEVSSGNFEILETNYEDMKRDPLIFFKQIFTFYELPLNETHLARILKKLKPKKNIKKYNFRMASANEYKEILTPEQIEKANFLLGKDFSDICLL